MVQKSVPVQIELYSVPLSQPTLRFLAVVQRGSSPYEGSGLLQITYYVPGMPRFYLRDR